jgi:hypothetical protein
MKVIATNMPDRFIECEWELSVKIQKNAKTGIETQVKICRKNYIINCLSRGTTIPIED